MRSRSCCLILFIAFVSALSPLRTARAQPEVSTADPVHPNILWITTEDMSAQLGAYGDEIARTPNLDRLADEGIRYTNVYSVYGVCAPNRSALITGLYPSSYGAHHMRTTSRTASIAEVTDPELLAIPTYEAVPPPEARLLSELLRRHGYYATNNAKEDYQFTAPVTAWDESSPKAHWRNRLDADTPFFAVFNIEITHESQIWGRAGEPLVTDPDAVEVPPYYPDTPVVRRDIARNYDHIALMDDEVGRILDELQEDGLLDETIVFFFSDHGSGLPRAKRWVYDSGLHVPLIVRFPHARRAGAVEERLVSFVDFAPTVLSLAGVPVPEYLPGMAFLGPAEGPQRRYVHAARDRMDPALDTRRAVRDARYKYIRNYRPERPYVQVLPYRDQMPLMQEILRLRRDGGLDSTRHWQLLRETKPLQELYDTVEDPHEINNLAEDPRYREKLLELRQEQERWFDEIDDMGLIPEPVLKNMLFPPYGEQPETDPPELHAAQARGGVIVRLTSATHGASIGYRAGSDDTWKVYTRPFFVPSGASLTAVAHRIGFKPSPEIDTTFSQRSER